MSMSRRGFLKGIIAAAMAPAIVRAESLMPIYVPKQELIIPDQTLFGSSDYLQPTSMAEGFGNEDFTIETWMKPVADSEWKHVAQVRRGGYIECYINGVMVPAPEFEAHGFKIVKENGHVSINFDRSPDNGRMDTYFHGQIDDVRVTSLAREPSALAINQQQRRSGDDNLNIQYHFDAAVDKANREVAKFEAQARRGIQSLESFVDRADAIAKQETPTGLLAALLGRV